MQKLEGLIDVLLDPNAGVADRDNAAMDLGRYDDPEALDALIQVASDASAPAILQWAAGASIGEIWHRAGIRDVETFASMTQAARRECIALLFARVDS